MTKFTVIATSGYQGDTWRMVKQFEKRAEAVDHANVIHSPHARDNTYITAVIGDVKVEGYDFVGDTRRVNVNEQHLKHIRCFIASNDRTE